MCVTAPTDRLRADEYVTRLVRACEQMGYDVHVHEPSTRITVSLAEGRPYSFETVTLKATEDDELFWFWSWGHRIGPAAEIGEVAGKIAHVVRR